MKYVLKGEQSQRLIYRPLTPADYNDWLPFFNNPKIYPYLFLDSSKSPQELCTFWMDKVFARYEANRGGLNALIHQHTGALVGQCGLLVQDIENELRLEVGYSLLPEYYGHGYASEAAQFCKNHAFVNNHEADFTNDIVSMIHIENKLSIKVALRNGMILQKTFEAYENNSFHVYGIDRTSWVAQAAL